MSTSNRVVVTGIGIISPLGIGVETVRDALLAKKSGIDHIKLLAATALPGNVAGECAAFTEEAAKKEYLKAQRKSIKLMCREIALGVASANLAIGQSAMHLETINHDRLGIEFGANQMYSPTMDLQDGAFASASDTNQFQFDEWGGAGLERMDPLWLLKYLPNMPACHIGINADARGPNNSLTMAEATSNNVLAEALGIIRLGRADIMLAGTTGSRVHEVKALHARIWGGLADCGDAPPATWCRPFDATRCGQVVGEGACTFVLETEAHAQSRGATIIGELLGAGSSCVLGKNGTPDCRQAMANAMRSALRMAGVDPADIGHINAHGLATKDMDIAEAAAIHDVFGAAAEKVPVTAIKSYLGNSGSACGNLELAASLIGLRQGLIPATLNFATSDPDCRLNVVHGEHLATTNKLFLSINVTCIGQAAAVVLAGR